MDKLIARIESRRRITAATTQEILDSMWASHEISDSEHQRLHEHFAPLMIEEAIAA